MAKVDYFLKIGDIVGESKDSKFQGHIEVEGWNWSENNGASFAHGEGGGAGMVAMQDFNFSAKTCNATPDLAQACASGTHIDKAVLTCRKAGDNPQVFLKITMSDVVVSHFQFGGAAGGGADGAIPSDQVALAFARIGIEYGKQDEKGVVKSLDQKMAYDLKQRRKV